MLWKNYSLRRATLASISADDGRSPRQIQRVLRVAALEQKIELHLNAQELVVLVMDTTYFDTFGVMVFRCATRRRNLFWMFVGEETNEDYLVGLTHLQSQGFTIAAVVCDGKRWLAEQIEGKGILVQLCQFHFTKAVTRHLTRHPKTCAGRTLRSLVLNAKRMNKTDFTQALVAWHEQWGTFLKEKTVTPGTGRWQYTHIVDYEPLTRQHCTGYPVSSPISVILN